MIVTAWNNGSHNISGAGYGLKISYKDRDNTFQRNWHRIILKLPSSESFIEVNINKNSFWNNCSELIHKDIGVWFYRNNLTPWPKGKPPKFRLIQSDSAEFRLEMLNIS